MRYYLPAAAVGLCCLMTLRTAPASPPPAAPPAAPAAAQTPASDSFAAAAAARHVRRTACLKEARAKKLVGAGRNSYIKACVGP